jgi:3-hydroxyacyl-CoA dehydrogenase
MGQGIAELLVQKIGEEALEEGGFSRRLTLVDPSMQGLTAVRRKLERRGRSFAEKEIVSLRKRFSFGVSNRDYVEKFTEALLDQCFFERGIDGIQQELFIFEATKEDEALKLELLKTLSKKLSKEALFFSNTSSIPIHRLEKPIHGRLAGLHFYNPATHQPIVEVVILPKSSPWFSPLIDDLLKSWQKERVESPDIPGFIGNGFLIPEIELALSFLPEKSVEEVNSLTRDELFHPMGIFELADFVGRDTIIAIAKMMGEKKFPLILKELPTLPLSKKSEERKKISEDAALEGLKKNLKKDPGLKAFLEGLKKISEDLIQEGVDEQALERVLKGGFRQLFVPWDRRFET